MRYFKKEVKGEAEGKITGKGYKERRELSDKLTSIFFFMCLGKET